MAHRTTWLRSDFRPVSITEASAGIDTDGILTKNPFRYRGYYYDSETGFYNLNLRYYDPTICRFISADSMDVLTVETTAVNCKNLFSYCENNPVIARDSTGAFWDTLFDVVSLAVSVVDVFRNPVNMQSLLGLAGDVIDLCPFVSGVGEAIKGSRFLKRFGKAKDATKAADNALDASKATTKLDNVVEVGTPTKGVGNPVKVEGKGNTGRILPNTLNEQMAMNQVLSNPLEGATKVPIEMTDSRWLATDGWVKMQSVVQHEDGTKTTIHFVYNEITGAFDDFKFK